ncbi:MAG: hypothetical protein Kow0040_29080 [Thermogutta sp.]
MNFSAKTLARGYFFATLGLACVLASHFGQARAESAGANQEAELIALVKSDAPKADKALACKKLAIYGGPQAAAALAPLLDDPELNSWARIALEAIPDPEADRVLREAAGRLQGRILIGVLNSIGVRRDAEAVDILAKHLNGNDPVAAAAAAVALGRIGTPSAVTALEPALTHSDPTVRNAAAEGIILIAEQRRLSGAKDEAKDLYARVRNADVPSPRSLEAVRGLILIGDDEGFQLFLSCLKSEDRELFGMALTTAREIKTPQVAEAIAAELAQRDSIAATEAPRLTVVKAVYGAGDQMVDVTDALTGMIRGGSLFVQASNGLAGDPAPGVVKELRLTYELGGERKELTLREGEGLQIGAPLPPQDIRAAALVEALGDIGGSVAVKAIREAAATGSWDVRAAAVRILGQIGDASVVPTLLRAAQSGGLGETALESISAIQDKNTDSALIEALEAATGSDRVIVLDAIGRRTVTAALPQVLNELKQSDAKVRLAAIRALGMIVDYANLDTLLDIGVRGTSPEEVDAALQALVTACSRMEARDGTAEKLMAAIRRAPPALRPRLAELLSTVPGAKSLQALRDLGLTGDDSVQDAVSRVLGEWMSADAAPVLLDLAKNGGARYRVRALRGYIRIARQLEVPLEQRIAMCRDALSVATRADEKKLVLEVLVRYPTVAGLELATSLVRDPEVKKDAGTAAVAIADKLPADARAAITAALNRVIESNLGEDVVERARQVLAK